MVTVSRLSRIRNRPENFIAHTTVEIIISVRLVASLRLTIRVVEHPKHLYELSGSAETRTHPCERIFYTVVGFFVESTQ